jgi:hypothetical protein
MCDSKNHARLPKEVLLPDWTVGTNKVQIKKGTKGDRVKPARISRLPKFSYSVLHFSFQFMQNYLSDAIDRQTSNGNVKSSDTPNAFPTCIR